MDSYVNLEKEVSKTYREELNLAKKPEEVREAFVRAVERIISSICDKTFDFEEEVKFTPEDNRIFSLGKIGSDPDVENALNNSDLKAILERFAEEAKNRYLHLIHDDDRTSMFKKHPV
ncbi:hypothetical protein [Mesoaciditoga lauensis]|uniref:hypothetical protein n=1 Tax=Mesoaciditoga lauensis TaxID=1495039 RepID=UPI00056BD66A|nr:hypothetical protein [Mesoaciditoga lauensis]